MRPNYLIVSTLFLTALATGCICSSPGNGFLGSPHQEQNRRYQKPSTDKQQTAVSQRGTDPESHPSPQKTIAKKETSKTKPLAPEDLASSQPGNQQPSQATKAEPDKSEVQVATRSENQQLETPKLEVEPEQVTAVTLTEVLEELASVREIDADLYEQLKSNLKQTDPQFWPIMAKSIRAALTYREEQINELRLVSTARPDNRTQQSIEIQPAIEEESLELVPSNTKHNMLRESQSVLQHSTYNTRVPNQVTENPFKESEHARSADQETDKESMVVDEPTLSSAEELFEKPQSDFRVQQAGNDDLQDPSKLNWQGHLRDAIPKLNAELSDRAQRQTPDSLAYESDQALLRMLHLATTPEQNTITEIPQLNNSERQQFWVNLFESLQTYLDANGVPVADKRADESLQQLRVAVTHLANLSQLRVSNLAFCSKVESYGRYAKMEPYVFQSDQEVLLYVEIDNFATEIMKTSGQYKTELEGSYQIIGPSGERVANHVFPIQSEICRNRRRDYFIPYRMWMPKTLGIGQYTLQLTVEDTIGQKFGQASIVFEIDN
ncbi:MAG: hypothetical protein CMJ81_04615 [Planctomycetaceae bacterium]|nr:hypothetical protein [Planctomycetaceae bacterium]